MREPFGENRGIRAVWLSTPLAIGLLTGIARAALKLRLRGEWRREWS